MIISYITIFRILIDKINIRKLYLTVSVGANESKNCAMSWYGINLLLSYVFYLLKLKQKVKNLRLQTHPNFLSEKTKISFDLEICFCIAQIFECVYIFFRVKR